MAGRTYRYMDEEKILYPFGFGLGYSRFVYETLQCEVRGEVCKVSVEVTNASDRDGEEVVQLYVSPPGHASGQPRFRLLRFDRRSIAAGKKERVGWEIPLSDLAFYNEEGRQVMLPGNLTFHAGGCSPFAMAKELGAAEGLSRELEVSSSS